MAKKIVWLLISCLMAISLVMASCGTAEIEEEEEVSEEETGTVEVEDDVTEEEEVEPKYGGWLNLSSSLDLAYFDGVYAIAGQHMGYTLELTNQGLWAGDWAKGPAGGYGTNETDWLDDYDLFRLKTGHLAESWEWSVDAENNEGTIVYQIREGVRWSLNQNLETSCMVGGRAVTADDVVYELKRAITDPKSYNFGNSFVRQAEITKTGPMEVTVKCPIEAMWQCMARFGDALYQHPQEVAEKYGNSQDWQNSIGTGPFMLDDFVGGSVATMVRNPNYWMKDPVGPGKGNQLPYLDGVKLFIIPDQSTRYAALRTGKIDHIAEYGEISWENAPDFRKTAPGLLEKEHGLMSGSSGFCFNTKAAPFDDVKVRQALLLATDLDDILDGYYGGVGQILTWPYPLVNGYEDLYIGLDDPEMPEAVKELYIYNPDKAKQLLAEAGYPDGFKFSMVLGKEDVDYYSIMVDMFSKVGVEMDLNVQEGGAVQSLQAAREYDATAGGQFPISIWYIASALWGNSRTNYCQINDPYINESFETLNKVAFLENEDKAVEIMREVTTYVLEQAYVIPRPRRNASTFWWPWIKNYSGEFTLGYHDYRAWSGFVWLDEDLKKSMGY